MNKYYFSFLCALMVAACAMAAPQLGDRIVAAEALSVDWNDAALRPNVDGSSFSVGYKAQLSQSEDENVLILSGLCDMFYIPVHVDYAAQKAWIETGTPLDAYTDQYERDVVRVIYAMPEQWLIDAEANMNTNLYGTIHEDGSITFDGGIVFLVSESTTEQDLTSPQETNETVWMSSPLFSDICLLVPNAIHQFSVENGSDMSLLIPKRPFLYEASMQVVRVNYGVLEEQGFKPRNPNGPPPVCGPGSGNHKSADTPDGQSADGQGTLNAVVPSGYVLEGGFKPKKKGEEHCCSEPGFGNLVVAVAPNNPLISSPVIPFPNGNDNNGKDWKVVFAGKKPFVPREVKPCGGGIVGNETESRNNHNGLIMSPSIPNWHDFGTLVLLDSAGKRPIIPPKPRPCRPDGSDEVGRLRPNGGGNVSAPNQDNDNIEAGYKPKKRPPVNGCSDPWIMVIKLENERLPERFGPNPSVASSKSDNEEFSVPVYVFQNPDNTITVYNIYGSGGVMTCKIAQEERKVSIADVTELIDQLLTAGNDGANQAIDDVNGDGKITIDDATTLIDMLLHNAN